MFGEWLSAEPGRERTEQPLMVQFVRIGNSGEARLPAPPRPIPQDPGSQAFSLL